MCIKGSVGKGQPNNHKDVVVVQVLLQYQWRGVPYKAVGIDGGYGKETGDAILDFQTRVQRVPKPDGIVSPPPTGKTIAALREGMPSGLDLFKLRGIMVFAKWERVLLYYKHLLTTMESRSINTSLRQAHFLAQLGHESGSLKYTEETASGEAYEGRKDLGNTQKGDGTRFKGRGLIQLTGRSNYEAYGEAIGQDLTEEATCTKVATDPGLAVDVAGWFWGTHDLNTAADTDDVKKVTKIINGGYNGLADRQEYLERAKFFLGL
jgi:putative chitinase